MNELELIDQQRTEINILIRKKDYLQDEICELQVEINRLKNIERMYYDLCKELQHLLK